MTAAQLHNVRTAIADRRDVIAGMRGGRASPATLLLAEVAIVPFQGRRREIAALDGWCDEQGGLSAQLIVGPAGQGKTRLAYEVVTRQVQRGWIAGFLASNQAAQTPSGTDIATLAGGMSQVRGVLIVVDCAETWNDVLYSAISELRTAASEIPVRFLLLARNAGEWLTEFQLRMDLTVGVMNLGGLSNGPLERASAWRQAIASFSAYLGTPNRSFDPAVVEAPNDLQSDLYANPLLLQMTALNAVMSPSSDMGRARRPEEAILAHERRYWMASARSRGLTLSAHEAGEAVALSILLPARTEAEAAELLRGMPRFGTEAIDLIRSIARWLHNLYSQPVGNYWGGLMPDRVAEYHVGLVIESNPDALSEFTSHATDQQLHQVLIVLARTLISRPSLAVQLGRLFTDHPELATVGIQVAMQFEDPGPLLNVLTDFVRNVDNIQTLTNLVARLPDRSVRMADFAVFVQDSLIRRLNQQSAESVGMRAAALSNLAIRLGDSGRREEALAASEEAAALYRQLAEARPDAFLPDLAASLNNLAIRLGELGRRDEALAAAEESVAMRRRLAEARPAAFLPHLATSLNNLAVDLADLGRREEALAASEEAAALYRQLAEARPDAFLPDLGVALINLAPNLSDLGRGEEALAAAEEAVMLYRRLAQARPDAFLLDLAASLNSLAIRLGDLGRGDEALSAAEEAVALYRQLAEARPDAFLPDLAASLNNLAIRLRDLGRGEEALEASRQGNSIRNQLASN